MKLTLKALIAFAISVSFQVFTQDAPPASGEDKKDEGVEEQLKSPLEKATDDMVANIKLALAAFKKANLPDEQRIKEFDNLIKSIKDANDKVSTEGELYKEVQETVKKQLEIQKKWERKSQDPETTAERRVAYKRLSVKAGDTAKNIANLQNILIDSKDKKNTK